MTRHLDESGSDRRADVDEPIAGDTGGDQPRTDTRRSPGLLDRADELYGAEPDAVLAWLPCLACEALHDHGGGLKGTLDPALGFRVALAADVDGVVGVRLDHSRDYLP